MAVHLSVVQAVELVGASVALVLGGYAWRNRAESGAVPLVVITAGVATWLVSEPVWQFFSLEGGVPPAAVLMFAGVTTTVAGWGAFALVFSGTRERVGPRVWALLAVEPVAVLVALLTNHLHGTFYRFDPATGEFLSLGVAYWAHAAYSYLVVVGGVALVASMLWRRQTLYPGQVYLVITGALLPWSADVLKTLGLVEVSLHGPALVGTCVCLTFGLFRHKLMHLSPAAQAPLLTNLRDGVFVLDRDGRFTDVNPTAAAILGTDGLEGTDGEAWLESHPDLGPHADTLVTATDEVSFEATVGDRHYDVRVTPLFDHRDELVGRQVQLHEVTEQRRREQELERQNERLDRFASVLSHDLRNPLNVATGRTELVQETGDVRHVDDIEQALDRIEGIIDEMLTLTREGQAVESVEPVSLETVAETAWETVDTGAGRMTVETGHRIEADRERTVRLFENLFRNAVEHGSTSPDSQARRDAVEHGSTGNQNASRSGDAVEHGSTGNRTPSDDAVGHAGPDVTVTVGDLDGGFFVADDGPGIPEEDRERVLEYGYTSETGGTGLGLSIVTSIAEAHGWTVTVTEGESGGARFEFRNVGVASTSAVSETADD